jgi:hypothetical protein
MSRRNGDPAYNRKILRPIAAQLTVKCNDSDGLVAGPTASIPVAAEIFVLPEKKNGPHRDAPFHFGCASDSGSNPLGYPIDRASRSCPVLAVQRSPRTSASLAHHWQQRVEVRPSTIKPLAFRLDGR